MDRRQQRPRLAALTLVAPHTGEARRSAQLPQLGVLLTRHVDGAMQMCCRRVRLALSAGDQPLAAEPAQLRLEPALAGAVGQLDVAPQQAVRVASLSRPGATTRQQAEIIGLVPP